MKRPEFTQEQEEWICYMIGEWYLRWKKSITNGEPHRLGFAKEHLKAILCADVGFFGDIAGMIKE